jgi:DNA-binding NtrC family response regulator
MPENTEPIRLLFVDDEEGILLTLAARLTRNGFNVTAVAECPGCAWTSQFRTL